MIAELGHFALMLALAVAAVQFLVPLYGAHKGDRALMMLSVPAAVSQLVLILIAFGALTQAYLVSDFSVENVWANSHSAKPLIYKIAGVWGNHEGSMVLWVLILALFGAAVAVFGTNLPDDLRARVVAVQGSIGLAFLLFIVATSSPFNRIDPPPIEGKGLNPLLQDPALAFHPPFLYMGYVGLSIAFSFAVAALISGRVDAAWARWVRPWTLAAWMFLTVGIAMGSWWAYYELGWGGWWFWDPVENASFMPWLIAAALLHSSIVVEKRNALKIWTVLLSILAFSLSLIGTFLVRSGVLTSVHAFAVDPERGVFILAILCVFIGGALALFAWRAPSLKAGGLFAPLSREGGLVLNNLLLCVACFAILYGTLDPLVRETLTGAKISVGAPFFDFVFGIIMAPLLIAVPFGPMLGWKRGDLLAAGQRLWMAAAAALVIAVGFFAFQYRGPWLAPLGIALGAWLIMGAASELLQRIQLFRAGFGASMSRLGGLPRSAMGMMLAHAGVGVMVIGITADTAWKEELIVAVKAGEAVTAGGYTVTLKSVGPLKGPNYTGEQGVFDLARNGAAVRQIVSERREFKPGGQQTTEVALHQTVAGDLYVVLGEALPGGARNVRVSFHPLISFIWAGATIMFFGGFLSLLDRRYRVGAPKRARTPSAVPAE